MNFWKKLAIVSILSIAVFFTQGIIDNSPAYAGIHKFSFKGDNANGYFIFDDSIRGGSNDYFKAFEAANRALALSQKYKNSFQEISSKGIISSIYI